MEITMTNVRMSISTLRGLAILDFRGVKLQPTRSNFERPLVTVLAPAISEFSSAKYHMKKEDTRKHKAEISVTKPKVPTIIGTVRMLKISPTASTTRRSDRYAPITPRMPSNNI